MWAGVPGKRAGGLMSMPTRIGRHSGPNAYQAIDEVIIWDRALSEEEVKALYNNGLGVSLRTEGER